MNSFDGTFEAAVLCLSEIAAVFRGVPKSLVQKDHTMCGQCWRMVEILLTRPLLVSARMVSWSLHIAVYFKELKFHRCQFSCSHLIITKEEAREFLCIHGLQVV